MDKDKITIPLKYRNFSYETVDGITAVKGELVNMDEILAALVTALVEDGTLAQMLSGPISLTLTEQMLEVMTPEELTAIWSRYPPPDLL